MISLHPRTILGGAVVAALTVGCADQPVAPAAGPPAAGPGPAFSLVADTTTPHGAPLADVTITIPDTGGASGSQALWTSGQVTGPALLAVSEQITLGDSTLTAAEVLLREEGLYQEKAASRARRRDHSTVDAVAFPRRRGGRCPRGSGSKPNQV